MYDDYIYDNDHDDSVAYTEWMDDRYYDDDDGGECDRCGADTPNGHGHYINDDTERVCGDCYDKETNK